ncbi:hypothetical protein NLG97_g1347 [Lecanicillium saksenae]|uniref:Uncharacterized protein n=1 Tax=Lecanicillium saksenae TaxID=468837 RepID=A0ACC1R4N3_9HYPO|nr:hypothetical protein NLG97_g1347 [Lecanicillium saksenae]
MSVKGSNSVAGCLHGILGEERAVFAIGGVICSAEPSSLSGPKSFLPSPTSRSFPSVTIRWEDLADKPTCHTVSLPVLNDDGQEEFADLVRDYHEGRGVNDFMIYSSSRTQKLCCDPEPRSNQDFGSLLVCLPYKHEGGSITLLRREHEDNTERMELDWAKNSGSCKIQWVSFLNPTDVSQTKMISGHSVILTYILSRTTHRIGEAPVALPILDVTTHAWYRTVETAVERALPKMRSIGGGGITLGYSCTGKYSFPLINFLPSAGDGLQGFLTGGDLLVYHIFARLARDVHTRIILNEPTAIQPSVECAQPADDEQETRDAADSPAPPDLLQSVCWLNYSPWSPSGSWREMLLSGGPGRGREGLEGRPCMTVIVSTLTAGRKEPDLATPPTSAATSYSQKRKRLLEDDRQRSLESSFPGPSPSGSQGGFTLHPGDQGYVDLTGVLDSSMQPRTCSGCHGCGCL